MAGASGKPGTWSDVVQTAQMVRTPRGQYVPGYLVEFTTGLGNRGSISVAREDYNPANVVALIKAHVAELDQVSQSGS